jgi:O-antigen/teichoic acid export membrane protein
LGIIQRQAFRNSIITYIGIVIGFINLLILQPYILLPDQIGLTRIILSAAIIISTFFPLGTNSIILKYFPQIWKNKEASNGFIYLMIFITILSYCLFAFTIHLLQPFIVVHYSTSSMLVGQYFYVIYLISLAIGITSIYVSLLTSLLKTVFASFMNDIFLRVFMSLILILYLFRLISFDWFMKLFFLSYFIQMLALTVYTVIIFRPTTKADLSFFKDDNWKKLANFSVFITVASVASICLKNADVLIIGQRLSLVDVAVYSISMLIGTIIEVPLNALSKIADAKVSYAFAKNNKNEMAIIYLKSSEVLTFIGAVLFSLVWININDLLSFLPQKYWEGVWIVRVVSIGAFVNMCTGVNTSLITYSDKYRYILFLLIGLVIFLVISNLILIPIFGILGAAISFSLSTVLYNLIKSLIIWRMFNFNPLGKHIFVNLLLIALAVIPLLTFNFSNLYVNIIVKSTVVMLIFLFSAYKLNLASDLFDMLKKKKAKA